jgi:hypothetical protein
MVRDEPCPRAIPPRPRYALPVRRVILYAVAGGILLALLKILEYQYFVRAYPGEVYGGLVAVIFSALGIYLGVHWTRSREVVVGVNRRVQAVLKGRELGLIP